MRLAVSQLIERPAETVFDWYAVEHVRNHPRWDPDIDLWMETEGPLAIGTVIRRRNRRFGTAVEGTVEVVEYDPPRAFGVVIREGHSEINGRAIFEPVASNRTLLIVSAEFGDMEQGLSRKVHGLMQRSVGNIKHLLEREVPAGR